MRRLLVVLAAIAVTAMVAAPAAFADQPVKITEEFTTDGVLADCGDFEAGLTEDGILTTKEFYKKGELDRIQFHLSIDGTVYNSAEPEKSLSTVAHYNFLTYVEDLFVVWTQHGLFYRIDLPQGGHALIDAGTFIVEIVDDEPVVLWQSGPHPFDFAEGNFEAVCEALE